MSEKIEPGNGWRLLRPEEILREGDQFVGRDNTWTETYDAGMTIPDDMVYRRKIPDEPKPFVGESISTYKNGGCWIMETSEEKTPLDGNEARNFASWLNEYSDWIDSRLGNP